MIACTGSLDKVGLESHTGHSHPSGGSQSEAVRHAQWAQHVEVAGAQCTEKRLGHLHVPSQYGTYAQSGKTVANVFMKKQLVEQVVRGNIGQTRYPK